MGKKIIAGGGIVYNESGEMLFIFRRGKWDLPKGKLDQGETIEACAIREVEEETGLRNIDLGKLIDVTNHYYNENGKDIEKETHWFEMHVKGYQKLVPQLEEDIHDLKWVANADLKTYLENSYDNIVTIVNKAVGA